MKRKIAKLLFLLLFLMGTGSIEAQSLGAYLKAGDTAMEQKEYYNAMHYYDIVLQSQKTADVYYKYAQAARLSYAYLAAEEAYKKVVSSKEKRQYPLLEFYYGLTLKHNGKYMEAKRAFKYFLDSYKKDNFYKEKAEQEYKSCDVAKQLVKTIIPNDSLVIEHLGEEVNTKFSDFGAHEVDGQLYYSSLRFERLKQKGEKNKKRLGKRLISKLLVSVDSTKGKEIDNLNIKSEHSANSSWSADGKRLYFTRCNGKSSDSLRCDIYFSTRGEDGQWTSPQRLPNPINSKHATTTHPHISYDEINQKEWLYFVSDRAGGIGDLDIWKVEINEASEEEILPINLGEPINTRDAEVTPFYDHTRKRLYFASRWHYGLGGYDIFYSEDKGGSWSMPQNIGIPFNSAANDLYFVINKGDSTGYFASNRDGSRSITKEACCNDIYAYQYPHFYPAFSVPKEDSLLVQVPIVPFPDTVVLHTPSDTSSRVDSIPTTIVQIETQTTVDELNDLLPLRFYFHNDEPDSNTMARATNTLYEESYTYYTSLLEVYKEEYGRQFDVEKGAEERTKIERFFEEEVKGEYNRSAAFLEKLRSYLVKGVALKMYIRGYTSPRASEKYNIALSARRVAAIRSYILRYKDLGDYVSKEQLIIKEALLGESVAPTSISDDYRDPQNSIYGVDASRERKAEISVVKFQ